MCGVDAGWASPGMLGRGFVMWCAVCSTVVTANCSNNGPSRPSLTESKLGITNTAEEVYTIALVSYVSRSVWHSLERMNTIQMTGRQIVRGWWWVDVYTFAMTLWKTSSKASWTPPPEQAEVSQ